MSEALAFDLYGTLLDPILIWRQLEFTFRLTAMGRYEDFLQVTRKALDATLALVGKTLDTTQKDLLMAQYDALEPFPDVQPALERLQRAGMLLVVFSNGTPAMLKALLDTSGLRGYFQGMVSVDEVKVYKPTPGVYQHAAQRLGKPLGETRLISANPFDVIGAEAAGVRSAWVNRSGGSFDPLGPYPDIVVRTLSELAEVLLPS